MLVQTEGSTINEVLAAGGYVLLCALGSLGATFIVGFFVAKIAAGLAMRLREKVFDKTMSFSMEELGRFSTASLITRSTNDITQIQSFVAMGLGCWSCWWTTPGKCVHKDLDEFYREYLAADTVDVYCKVSQGFVTSNMKAMIDRMIVLVLPYISWDNGESYHDPRYDKYPSSVTVVYNGEFLPGEEDAFIAYWKRTMDMLFVKEICIKKYEAAQEVPQ